MEGGREGEREKETGRRRARMKETGRDGEREKENIEERSRGVEERAKLGLECVWTVWRK